jgi:hypothetical protein
VGLLWIRDHHIADDDDDDYDSNLEVLTGKDNKWYLRVWLF